jgi:hypothetical protein
MSRDLTVRQRKFIQGYLEGKPMTRAAVEAGYSTATAARGASELLRSVKVQATIQEAMDASGITREKLASTLASALDAERPVTVRGDVRPWPDHKVRLKATEFCLFLAAETSTDAEDVETHEQRVIRLRKPLGVKHGLA